MKSVETYYCEDAVAVVELLLLLTPFDVMTVKKKTEGYGVILNTHDELDVLPFGVHRAPF